MASRRTSNWGKYNLSYHARCSVRFVGEQTPKYRYYIESAIFIIFDTNVIFKYLTQMLHKYYLQKYVLIGVNKLHPVIRLL